MHGSRPARRPEIRFLRKFIGWSATDFASHMGTDPSTVSNWETDKKPIGSSSDRLLRLMVVQHDQVDDDSLDALMDISSEQEPPIELHMRPRNGGWQRDVVAADGA